MSGKFGDLRARLLTALVALPLLLGLLLYAPPLATVAVAGAAIGLGLLEYYKLLAARGLRPLRFTGLLLTAFIFLEEVQPGWAGPALWPLAALLLLTSTLRRADDLAQTVPAAAGTFMGATYLGALGGTLAGLRVLEPVELGGYRLLLLIFVVMMSDVFAYFAGHLAGRHRLAPLISPGKTVEGALGGLLGGALGAWLIREAALPGVSLPVTLALGVAVAAMGIVGDLLESLLKRWAGAKDSGALFPGHGGMLDRLDSLLFGAPVLYYFYLYQR